ncbi:MAG TPA: TraB/GumN family protein [Lysobacter sp.]
MHRSLAATLSVLLSLATPTVVAQERPDAPVEPPIRDMETLVVSGVQPGPGLWKVRKGDHTLFVLGTLSPLPKRMQWESRDVENVIAQAQEVIDWPGVKFETGLNTFQELMLAPKALGARKDPEGKSLQQVVPADMYARWLPLKARYIGRDKGIEEWRPMFAALKLYDEAMDDSGLKNAGDVIRPAIERLARRHDVKRTDPMLTVMIADPKVALKEFRESRLDDLDCFGRTLQRLETDLDTMRERANAWAVGDLDTIRALPYSDQNEACRRAAAQATVLRKRAGDLEAKMEQLWLATAEQALARNTVTFALLSMRQLMAPDGYIAKLRAKGYEVEEP